MYKKHKILVLVFCVVIALIELLLKLNYYEVAEHSISVISIALGIYVAALTSLLGSKTISSMKNTPDLNVPGQSQLGVLLSYFRHAMFCGLVTIAMSYFSIFSNSQKWFLEYPYVTLVASALGFVFLALNFLYMWLLFSFVVNTIVRDA